MGYLKPSAAKAWRIRHGEFVPINEIAREVGRVEHLVRLEIVDLDLPLGSRFSDVIIQS